MKTIWNGALSFGLVHVPVGLATATSSEAVTFKTLHRDCKTPIKQKRVCPVHDLELGPDEVVKGWEVSKGNFVVVEEDELNALYQERSGSIEISSFVDRSEVDPVYFDRTYYLVPAKVGQAQYALILRALLQTGMAGVGEVVLRGKPHPVLVRAVPDGLVLETLHYDEDVRVRDHETVDLDVNEEHLAMAVKLIETLQEPFVGEPTSDYRAEVKRLLESKLSGQPITKPEPAQTKEVGDIHEALMGTLALAQARKREPRTKTASKPKAKRKAA